MSRAVLAPIEIITPSQRYRAVGHCIYCGTYSNSLTNEHIIPHGLAGDSLVLPKSSCKTCAAKTRDWETACLRHLWWPFRTRIGTPSSGKQPPKDFVVRQMRVTELSTDGNITSYEKLQEKVVGPTEFPFVFMTYDFPPPGLLLGRNPDVSIDFRVLAKVDEDEFRKFAPNDKEGFKIAPLNVVAYCRMLAKIAHSYAVAEIGESSFKSVLRKFIRGQPLEHAWHWIGSETPTPVAEQHLHDIQWLVATVEQTNYALVSLRLFSFMGAPRYHIVVGELTRSLTELPFLKQPLHTIDVKTVLPFGQLSPLNQKP